MLELILVKAIVMEVDMKLAKNTWKQKADRAINRLKAVCSQWSNILLRDFCRTEVNSILDNLGKFLKFI